MGKDDIATYAMHRMLNPVRWYKNNRSWWKDRKDSPVYRSELRAIRESVRRAVARQDTASWRPVLTGRLPEPDSDVPVLLACCDENYFYKFGRQLAISAILADPVTRIHIHIYDPGPLCTADAEFLQRRLGHRLTISAEGPERNPYRDHSTYFFAAGRFAVAAEILQHCGAPVMIVDVDGVVRRGMSAELAKLNSFDVGLVMRPGKLKPWRRILACAVFVNATESGTKFIQDTGAAVALALRSCPTHHVDQTILNDLVEAYASTAQPLTVAGLSLTWGDHEFSEESMIWSAKGGRKQGFHGITLKQAREVFLIS